MRIALVSDLHIHDWTEFRVVNDSVPSRLAHCVDVLEEIHSYCNEHDIDVIAIVGDLFHKRNVIYTRPYQMVVEVLAHMKRNDKVVLAVDGNHDHADKAGTVHTIDTLWSAELVTQAVPPQDGWANWEVADELLISAFSYCDDRTLLERRMDLALKTRPSRGARRIGLFHHGFKGARVGSALEYVVKEDIEPAQLANRFDFVFSGHYHGRQEIGGMANALYLGSPLQHIRGEGKEPKGFTVYDSKTNTAELVSLHRPRFVKVTQERFLAKSNATLQRINGNFVDFHYEVGDPNVVNELHRAGAVGVKLVPVRQRKSASSEQRLAVDPTLDTKTVLKRYLKYRKDDIDHLDQTELLRIGLDLFNRGED